MAYTKDQLFSFRFTTAVPVIPRSVRKTLFKLRIWNPRRHRATPVVGTLPNISTARAADSSAGVYVQAPPTREPAAALRLPGLLTVASLNARSVRNKSADICDVIKQHGVHLFTICETWHEKANDLSVRSICPDGYRSLDSPRSTSGCRSAGQQGGGLVLIYRDSIGAKRIPIDLIPSTFEFVLAMLKLPRSNIVTLAIYRTGAITAEFFDELTSMLELLVVYSCPVLITGDINIHPSGRSSRRQCHQVQRHLGLVRAQPVGGRANSFTRADPRRCDYEERSS